MSYKKSESESTSKSWHRVGKVKSAHGLQGEFWVLLFAGEADWLENMTEFGLGPDMDTPARIIPAGKARVHKDGVLLKVPEIADRNASEAIYNHFFFISDECLVSDPGEQIFLAELQGFQVFDRETLIGTVDSFASTSFQDLLLVKAPDAFVYEIPFVEAFVLEVDYEAKKILMELPEGLLEVNRVPAVKDDDV